jgi:methionine sulfoxide reductase catalytic subunit
MKAEHCLEHIMAIYRFPTPRPSEITPKSVFMNRRAFMGAAAGIASAGLILPHAAKAEGNPDAVKLTAAKSQFSTTDKLTPYDAVTGYNNFYEFGTGKEEPAENAGALTTDPWTIKVDGLVNNPGEIGIEELLKFSLEERIYRLRCVEAWSMVVPWVGFPLAELIKRYEVQGSAKYVAFETLVRPEEMSGQNGFSLEWPYVEGLRMDEAMHPLTILGVGLYGEVMPKQNGAPVRIVVPWKYGFKSIKSIVRISFVEEQPKTTWNIQAPQEYGFYSNVNPEVDHPRWSQASERRVGDELFAERIPTLKFNGYEEQVASLYAGMDLKANY